jgi:heat shock transcription factor
MLGKKRNNKRSNNISESFLFKLNDILNDNNYKNFIHWDTNGKRVIILDVFSLCNIVLPKYYKHNNYSSFVRQLNIYGFHKSKGVENCGDSYESDKFHRNITKEEISQIIEQNKKMKNTIIIKDNQKEEDINNDDALKYIFQKTEENTQSSLMLRKEMLDLKIENNKLNYEINRLKILLKNNANLVEKILKSKNESKVQRFKKNITNLKELFNGYLYFLKIYSPYVNIDNLIKLRSEQQEAQNKNKTNTDKKIVEHIPINNNNNNQNNINNESIYEEFSMFKDNNDFLSFNLNLEKNNSSKSLIKNSFVFH